MTITPHSYNFITQDDQKPTNIAAKAKAQVAQYNNVQFYQGRAIRGSKTTQGFEIQTQYRYEVKNVATGMIAK